MPKEQNKECYFCERNKRQELIDDGYTVCPNCKIHLCDSPKQEEKWDMEKELSKIEPFSCRYCGGGNEYRVRKFIHLSNQKIIEQAISDIRKSKDNRGEMLDYAKDEDVDILNSLLK